MNGSATAKVTSLIYLTGKTSGLSTSMGIDKVIIELD